MKKKLLAAILSVSLLSVMLAGCASSEADNAVDTGETDSEIAQVDGNEQLESGKVELRVWAEEADIECLQKMIDSFEQKYAGQAEFSITIEASSEEDARNNILGDIHNAADVFSMTDDQLYSLIASGALSPVANQDEIKNANLADSVLAASYNDTMYAYPFSADNGYFLYYNKKYLSESDVKTFDRILEVAAENEKKVTMDLSSGWYLYSFFGQTGLELGLNDDGVTNYCNWDSREGKIKGVDVAQALLDITTNPGFTSAGDAGLIEGAKTDTCIAGVSGVWNAVTLQEIWGKDYAACKLPTYTCNGQQVQMSSFKGYKMFGVNYYSDHTGWAHKLAEWLSNEENQKLRFSERMQGPSNINAVASDEISKAAAIAAVIDQSQYGVLQRVGNRYWDPCTEFANTLIAGNPDGKPLQDLMDILVLGITASVVQ